MKELKELKEQFEGMQERVRAMEVEESSGAVDGTALWRLAGNASPSRRGSSSS